MKMLLVRLRCGGNIIIFIAYSLFIVCYYKHIFVVTLSVADILYCLLHVYVTQPTVCYMGPSLLFAIWDPAYCLLYGTQPTVCYMEPRRRLREIPVLPYFRSSSQFICFDFFQVLIHVMER